MYCIYLKKRKNKPFCKLLDREITFAECSAENTVNNCREYETKNFKNSFYKKSTLNKKSPLKSGKIKKQTYKHQKADRNRASIITNNLTNCYICGKKTVNIHEIFYGSYRHTSIKWNLTIPLCLEHHTFGENAIHNNRKLDLKIKILAQTIFENKFSKELFIKEF